MNINFPSLSSCGTQQLDCRLRPVVEKYKEYSDKQKAEAWLKIQAWMKDNNMTQVTVREAAALFVATEPTQERAIRRALEVLNSTVRANTGHCISRETYIVHVEQIERIDGKSAQANIKPRNCRNCAKRFQPHSNCHRFCCSACQDKHRQRSLPHRVTLHSQCVICGKKFSYERVAYTSQVPKKTCSKECYRQLKIQQNQPKRRNVAVNR